MCEPNTVDTPAERSGSGPRPTPAETRARATIARTEHERLGADLAMRMSRGTDLLGSAQAALAEAQEKIANLQIALETSRRIGQAIGIIMERLKVTEDDAFAILRGASHRSHRKLRDVAEVVVRTGEVPSAA